MVLRIADLPIPDEQIKGQVVHPSCQHQPLIGKERLNTRESPMMANSTASTGVPMLKWLVAPRAACTSIMATSKIETAETTQPIAWTIELPEDVARALREKWGDLSQHTIETLALDGYRARVLSAAQVRRMFGLQTRMEVDAFLKQHGVYLDYTDADLDRDLETLHQLRQHDRRLGYGSGRTLLVCPDSRSF